MSHTKKAYGLVALLFTFVFSFAGSCGPGPNPTMIHEAWACGTVIKSGSAVTGSASFALVLNIKGTDQTFTLPVTLDKNGYGCTAKVEINTELDTITPKKYTVTAQPGSVDGTVAPPVHLVEHDNGNVKEFDMLINIKFDYDHPATAPGTLSLSDFQVHASQTFEQPTVSPANEKFVPSGDLGLGSGTNGSSATPITPAQ